MPTTRQQISQTRERFFLALAGVLVVAIGILAYTSDAAFRSGIEQADVTRQVVDSTNSLLSALKDAETGQRGFLLTGEDRYLEPYRQALAQVSPDLDKLTGIETQRNRPDQKQRVERLRPLVKEKLDELAQTIELRRAQGPDAALAIVRSDRGKAAMDQIRALCDEIQATSYPGDAAGDGKGAHKRLRNGAHRRRRKRRHFCTPVFCNHDHRKSDAPASRAHRGARRSRGPAHEVTRLASHHACEHRRRRDHDRRARTDNAP